MGVALMFSWSHSGSSFSVWITIAANVVGFAIIFWRVSAWSGKMSAQQKNADKSMDRLHARLDDLVKALNNDVRAIRKEISEAHRRIDQLLSRRDTDTDAGH